MSDLRSSVALGYGQTSRWSAAAAAEARINTIKKVEKVDGSLRTQGDLLCVIICSHNQGTCSPVWEELGGMCTVCALEEVRPVTRNAVIVPLHAGSLFPEKSKNDAVCQCRATSVT